MNEEENLKKITRTLLPTPDRLSVTATLFGPYFPLRLEPYVYSVAGEIAREYNGGYWLFYRLGNGGFYMAPDAEQRYRISCSMNYFEGEMSADALGLVACLTAYSHLSFGKSETFARLCAEHFHKVREFALDHPEAPAIFAAID